MPAHHAHRMKLPAPRARRYIGHPVMIDTLPAVDAIRFIPEPAGTVREI